MHLMGSVQRGTDQNIFVRQECEDIRIERLKIGANHEAHSLKPPPGEFGDRFHKIEPKEGLPTLELDLDLVDWQIIEKGQDPFEGFLVPIKSFSSNRRSGHLAIGAL